MTSAAVIRACRSRACVTSPRASTISSPASAALEVACPEGNDLLVSRPTESCHCGRARPNASFIAVHSREADTITTTAKTAARTRRRLSSTTTTSVVHRHIPTVANATSIARSRFISAAWPCAQRSDRMPRWSNAPRGERSWETISPKAVTTRMHATAPTSQATVGER